MKKLNKTLLLLVTVSTIFSCSTEGTDKEPAPEIRTVEDVIADFQNLNIQPGINDVRLETLVTGTYWNFRVISPSDASESNKRPLAIDLHGASGGSPSAHKNTDCYLYLK